MVLLTPIKKFCLSWQCHLPGTWETLVKAASFCFKWASYKYRSFGKFPWVFYIAIAITITLSMRINKDHNPIEFGQLHPFPSEGTLMGDAAPGLPEKQQSPALAHTQRSPGPSLGQFGQSCQSTTCQVPLTAEITAVSCSSEETAAEMWAWFPCTPWMWHRPSLNATPLCWAGANKRSEMMRVPHSSVMSVVWNSSDQSKSNLDFLDKWPDRQASCKWQKK